MCLLHVNQSKRTPEFYTFGKVKANSSISHTQVRVCEEELTLQEEGHKKHFDKKFDKALAAYDVLTNTTDSYLYAHTPAWSWSVSQETPMFPAHPSRTIEKFNTFAPRFNTSQICILPIGATILRSIDTCQIANFMTYFQVSRYSSIAVIWKKEKRKKEEHWSSSASICYSKTCKRDVGRLRRCLTDREPLTICHGGCYSTCHFPLSFDFCFLVSILSKKVVTFKQ